MRHIGGTGSARGVDAVQRPSSPNLGQWYEREQAAGRANAADAAGKDEAARVIRESMP